MKLTQKEKALRMLRRAGPRGVTNGQFLRAYIARYGARLDDLRRRGLRIEAEHVEGATWRYVMRRKRAA